MDQQRGPAVVLLTRAGLTLLFVVSVALVVLVGANWPVERAQAAPSPVTESLAAEAPIVGEQVSEALTSTKTLTQSTEAVPDAAPAPTAVPTRPPPSPDSACLTCHAGHEGTMALPSGDEIPIGIDPAVLDASVHGSNAAAPVYCTDCHSPRQRYQYPHVPTDAQTLHDFDADVAQNCQKCHTSAELHNPGHLQAKDNPDNPNCVDCHGGHNVQQVDQTPSESVAFCLGCHSLSEMENEQLQRAHADVVANLGPNDTCRTCHSDQPQTQSQQCSNCHSRMTGTITLEDGEQVSLKVDQIHVTASVHGDREIDGVQYTSLQCTDCHKQLAEAGFPHPEATLANRQELRLSVEQNCVDCHASVASSYADGVHSHAIQEGELNAASCANCHGSHDIQSPNIPRSRISDTCGKCHTEIYAAYATSVHGESLYGRQNPDVPVCTDCHGVHSIADPTQAQFRLSSPQMCGECHADKELMAEYGISTEVFDSYVSDFHGSTVTLFAHDSPNEPTNKAVCYDCHGIHDIQKVSDISEAQIQKNLLVTCQQCHPDANENFPSSWMGHYRPSLQHYPLVYLVNLFYLIFMPAVLGGFFLFIGADVFRKFTDWYIARRKRRS